MRDNDLIVPFVCLFWSDFHVQFNSFDFDLIIMDWVIRYCLIVREV